MEINKKLLKDYLNEVVKKTSDVIKFKSMETTPEENAPFGLETQKCLSYVLELAKSFGFKTYYGHNNEYGYAEYGDGEKIFGIVCHLDVVPSGDLSKWKKSPWDPIVEDGYLFGRGSLDDKGPTIVNLYALKYLKDHGWCPKKYRIRVIFGLTEETSWKSINSYLKHEQEPDIAYTPDGQWPVIYAEKTIINFDIVDKKGAKNLWVKGDGAYNVVNDITDVYSNQETIQELIQYFEKEQFEYSVKDVKNSEQNFSGFVRVKGKSAHACIPQTGINAIINLAESVVKTKNFQDSKIFNFIYDTLGNRNHKLETIFTDWKDETGEVSVNLGKIFINQNESRACFDARIPSTYTLDNIKETLSKFLEAYPGLELDFRDHEKSKYVNPKSDIIQKMVNIYRDVTGESDAQPLAIGGGTYARAMDNCVAFGACKHIDLMHNVNERISLKELEDMLEIYIKAIYALVD